ncbi:MAG: threonine/serine dehydratase [Planctomycetes bacterium]|nr:threonine/serine dehydratase [Planctomycetota bacterium]
MLSLSDIIAARARIKPYLRPTPLLFSEPLSRLAGRPVHLKLECWQETGSFKARGALNFCLQLSAEERKRGLVTASAGNHGQGTALACKILGARMTVFVPDRAPEAKKRGIRALGADLIEAPHGYETAHRQALRLAAEGRQVYVPACEDDRIMAGQGTVALEAVDELGGPADFMVPVGGGGLMAGVGVAAKGIDPASRLIGVQSEKTDAMHRSLAAGQLIHIEDHPTLCDGLAGDVEAINLTYAQRLLDKMVLVGERDVARGIVFLVREHQIIAEGSAAAGPAALLDPTVRESVRAALGSVRPLVVVITGRNIDMETLTSILKDADNLR